MWTQTSFLGMLSTLGLVGAFLPLTPPDCAQPVVSRMTSDSAGIKKTEIAKVRLTVDEKIAWTIAADQSDKSLSDFIRMKVEGGHEKKIVAKTDPALLREIARIGNNLNQIARAVNTHKSDVEARQIAQALQRIHDDIYPLREISKRCT